MKFLSTLIIGLFLGAFIILVVSPKLVLENRLQAKIEALEWLIVDHEKEINILKKRVK